jgi:hypothetical protein
MATETDKVLTHKRVKQARKTGQLTARRERLICCGTMRQHWAVLTPVQRKAIEISEAMAEMGELRSRKVKRRLTDWLFKVRRIWEESGISKPAELRLTYTECGLSYDVLATVAPWYGDKHYDVAGGLSTLQGGESSPHLVTVFNDVCPVPDVRTLLPAPDALRAWQEGTVVRLAQAIYQERAWDGMPILGDALEEAGCTSQEVLAHCRLGGIHVRGCWLLDWVLNLK